MYLFQMSNLQRSSFCRDSDQKNVWEFLELSKNFGNVCRCRDNRTKCRLFIGWLWRARDFQVKSASQVVVV
jgi:hypothetical protein